MVKMINAMLFIFDHNEKIPSRRLQKVRRKEKEPIKHTCQRWKCSRENQNREGRQGMLAVGLGMVAVLGEAFTKEVMFEQRPASERASCP